MDKDIISIIIEAQNGNEKAMQELIELNNGLIWSIVKRFQDRGYDKEELYQVGTIGFIKCVKRFETKFEVKLSTYAVPYIMGEIRKFIRDDGMIKVSRSTKDLGMKIRILQDEFYRKNGKEISVLEIAKVLKIPKEEIGLAMDAMKPVDSIYDDTYSDGESSISLIDRISNNIDETKMLIDKLSILELIKSLNEEEKKVIILRYYRSKTQSQVAKILGVSQVQISRLERKVLNSMRQKLKA